ncbi:MAG TPA: SUMF1/EgtB/PvdO family nonheme iron enzyme [Roseateles sp.]
MLRLPTGSFQMGSQRGEPGREGDEAPRHTVTLARPFWVSKHEVTEAQWQPCVLDQACPPLAQSLGSRHPATDMRWEDAQAYAAWLSKRTGKPYRLLTEAEWEYAARAGSDAPYPTGSTITARQANFAASGHGKPLPVGQYAPNAFGLHDMAGNVWEWVADCYDELRGYHGAPQDGSAATGPDCRTHVLRGGAFDTRAEQLRSAYRYRAHLSSPGIGLRLAMDDHP